jgi:hypothetical protein
MSQRKFCCSAETTRSRFCIFASAVIYLNYPESNIRAHCLLADKWKNELGGAGSFTGEID